MRDVMKVLFAILFGGGFLLIVFHSIRGLIKVVMNKAAKGKAAEATDSESPQERVD